MASTSVATQELIDQRLDTIDRALMGLMPRNERLKFMAETEVMLREGGSLNSELAGEAGDAQDGPRPTPPISRTGRRGRSRLALTSGVLGIAAALLLIAMPVSYIVLAMAGELIGEIVAYALLALNILAVTLGGAAAVVLGIAALVRLNRRNSRQTGHGWAITGLCAGPVPMLIGGISVLVFVLPMLGYVMSEYHDDPVAASVPLTKHLPGDTAVANHGQPVPAFAWQPSETRAPNRPESIEQRPLEPQRIPADPPPSGPNDAPPSAAGPGRWMSGRDSSDS